MVRGPRRCGPALESTGSKERCKLRPEAAHQGGLGFSWMPVSDEERIVRLPLPFEPDRRGWKASWHGSETAMASPDSRCAVAHLFLGSAQPSCPDAADADGSRWARDHGWQPRHRLPLHGRRSPLGTGPPEPGTGSSADDPWCRTEVCHWMETSPRSAPPGTRRGRFVYSDR